MKRLIAFFLLLCGTHAGAQNLPDWQVGFFDFKFGMSPKEIYELLMRVHSKKSSPALALQGDWWKATLDAPDGRNTLDSILKIDCYLQKACSDPVLGDALNELRQRLMTEYEGMTDGYQKMAKELSKQFQADSSYNIKQTESYNLLAIYLSSRAAHQEAKESGSPEEEPQTLSSIRGNVAGVHDNWREDDVSMTEKIVGIYQIWTVGRINLLQDQYRYFGATTRFQGIEIDKYEFLFLNKKLYRINVVFWNSRFLKTQMSSLFTQLGGSDNGFTMYGNIAGDHSGKATKTAKNLTLVHEESTDLPQTHHDDYYRVDTESRYSYTEMDLCRMVALNQTEQNYILLAYCDGKVRCFPAKAILIMEQTPE